MARQFGLISDSKQVEDMLSGLYGVIQALPAGKAKQAGRATLGSITDAFDDVSEHWGKLVENRMDAEAKAVRGFGYMHWMRHLYEGGHVDHMGVPGKRLIKARPEGSRQIGITFEARPDPTPSYSPVSNTTTGYWGQQYPAWPERAEFMFAVGIEGARDGKIIKGEREKKTPFAAAYRSDPMYIVNKRKGAGPDQPKYIFANKFIFDYRPQKGERDHWLDKNYKFSTDYLVSRLDETFRMTLEKHMDKLAVRANRNTPVPMVNPNRVMSPAATADRFKYNKTLVSNLTQDFSKNFERHYKQRMGGTP